MVTNKNLFKIFLVFGFLLFSLVPFISAEGVCCPQLETGQWCQNADITECNPNAGQSVPTACDQTSFCSLGTCIDSNEGICSSNTPKIKCEAEGGFWDDRDKGEISQCQKGCCLIGESTSFATLLECKQIYTDYGLSHDDLNFREDINNELTCSNLAGLNLEGACVYDDLDCNMGTKESCLSTGGRFEEGFLCTATHLSTICAKTENTRCQGDKIYFVDSCGNLANIYDDTKFTKNENGWDAEMEDYWTRITEPSCEVGETSEVCGDCNYRELGGTICMLYELGNPFTPDKPTYGENVCAELGCEYEGEIYRHGESWCAQTPGAEYTILADSDGFLKQESRDFLSENYDKYNLPGSRYYSLTCYDGEILSEPCSDYRNEICIQQEIGEKNYLVGTCVNNEYDKCLEQTDKTSCENKEIYCKWIPGYRFDREEKTTNTETNQEEQGSCVPLIAPGFKSWRDESDSYEETFRFSGQEICAQASIADKTIYETPWTKSRDKFGEESVTDAAHRCIFGCYLIPDFGLEYSIQEMFNIYTGAKFKSREDHISLRQFNYCDTNTIGMIGHLPVIGKDADCAKDEDKRRDFPIFFKNNEWISSIKDRSQSVGDCGYKPNIYSDIESIDKSLEEMWVGFVKLDQDGIPKEEINLEILYQGNDFLPGAYRN